MFGIVDTLIVVGDAWLEQSKTSTLLAVNSKDVFIVPKGVPLADISIKPNDEFFDEKFFECFKTISRILITVENAN
jgi:hypothetical protein